jgi:alkane 1-monooxygenase
MGLGDRIGLAVSIGCIGGIGINTAHEPGHKREANERWLSKIAVAQVAYGHFYIEHNRGHHVRVATPEDPASARLGETFHEFWAAHGPGLADVRVAPGEASPRRQGAAPFRIGNDVLNAWLMTAVLWGALVAWLGPGVTP